MSVCEQLVHLARLHGVARDDATAAAQRRIDQVGLSDRGDDRLEELSHGNQQRAQLAAAVVHDPDLLVLDEPFAGLDPLGVDAMHAVLRAEVERGAAVLFSSHQLDLVESHCDDVVIIDEGHDVLSGSLEDVQARGGQRRVEVAFTNRVSTEDLQRRVPDVEVLGDGDGIVRLAVAADVEPARLLDALGEIGDVRQFAYEPPHLSDLYREVVHS